MIRYIADDCDLKMESVPEFWLTLQDQYVVLNWRAITGRPMCHHLILCKFWQVEAVRELAHQLLELSDQIDA